MQNYLCVHLYICDAVLIFVLVHFLMCRKKIDKAMKEALVALEVRERQKAAGANC